MTMTTKLTLTLGLCVAAACGGDDTQPITTPDAADSGAPVDSECTRGELEADFQGAPLAGPAVRDGKLEPGEYVISSTYLRLRQDASSQARFNELMGPIMADLQAREGLQALAFGSSQDCGVARTLSVWRDDMAMLGFVASEAHSAAISSVTQVSRGGSLVTHWTGNEEDAAWATAVEHVGADDGPQY
jgi:hypothetical protein